MLAAPAVPPARGFYDECMRSDNIQFSLGFMKASPQWAIGSARSFGAPGYGWKPGSSPRALRVSPSPDEIDLVTGARSPSWTAGGNSQRCSAWP